MSFFFFLFKQKTAYEMRISDWSSDVCSSDLARDPHHPLGRQALVEDAAADRTADRADSERAQQHSVGERAAADEIARDQGQQRLDHDRPHAERSDEHTSELQSLMRISYAVFCLKKKKYTDIKPPTIHF